MSVRFRCNIVSVSVCSVVYYKSVCSVVDLCLVFFY